MSHTNLPVVPGQAGAEVSGVWQVSVGKTVDKIVASKTYNNDNIIIIIIIINNNNSLPHFAERSTNQSQGTVARKCTQRVCKLPLHDSHCSTQTHTAAFGVWQVTWRTHRWLPSTESCIVAFVLHGTWCVCKPCNLYSTCKTRQSDDTDSDNPTPARHKRPQHWILESPDSTTLIFPFQMKVTRKRLPKCCTCDTKTENKTRIAMAQTQPSKCKKQALSNIGETVLLHKTRSLARFRSLVKARVHQTLRLRQKKTLT